jgi:hypothetical protein
MAISYNSVFTPNNAFGPTFAEAFENKTNGTVLTGTTIGYFTSPTQITGVTIYSAGATIETSGTTYLWTQKVITSGTANNWTANTTNPDTGLACGNVTTTLATKDQQLGFHTGASYESSISVKARISTSIVSSTTSMPGIFLYGYSTGSAGVGSLAGCLFISMGSTNINTNVVAIKKIVGSVTTTLTTQPVTWAANTYYTFDFGFTTSGATIYATGYIYQTPGTTLATFSSFQIATAGTSLSSVNASNNWAGLHARIGTTGSPILKWDNFLFTSTLTTGGSTFTTATTSDTGISLSDNKTAITSKSTLINTLASSDIDAIKYPTLNIKDSNIVNSDSINQKDAQFTRKESSNGISDITIKKNIISSFGENVGISKVFISDYLYDWKDSAVFTENAISISDSITKLFIKSMQDNMTMINKDTIQRQFIINKSLSDSPTLSESFFNYDKIMNVYFFDSVKIVNPLIVDTIDTDPEVAFLIGSRKIDFNAKVISEYDFNTKITKELNFTVNIIKEIDFNIKLSGG